MRRSKRKLSVWLGFALLAVPALAALLWLGGWHYGLSAALRKEIRAGLAARHLQDPDARLRRYLEERYGSMADPNCRREAFLEFFNLDHIQALQLLVKRSPAGHRQENIEAMARWVEAYRNSLTPEERRDLNARFGTPEGQIMLRRATAQYNAQDVKYRGATAPVISQLLKTLRDVQQTQ